MSTSAAPPRMCCASHFFVFCGIGEMGGRRPCPGRRVSLNERRHPPNRRCSQACAACVDLAACAQDARTGRFMARQFIYHMQGLSKTYPGNRKVLENINLSFYPDAKIGVLGLNGSGKSTLLRIMAGIDQDYVGEGWVAEGARVGYLEQEPHLDPAKSVRENVMEGVAKQKAILERYNELAMNYSEETADEMTRLQDEIEAKGLWDLDSKVDQAMDALRCPGDDAEVAKLSGGERRRVALCRLLLEEPELLLLDGLTFRLPPGGIVGVIGPNGAGKTTLFRMITGQEKPDDGTIKVGESVRFGYVDQSRDTLEGRKSVWEEISGGLDQLQLGKREVNSRAYCSAFNFRGADQQKKVGALSGGERNRVHLAKMLKSGANLLLLDEPTNDLD